MRKIGNKRGQIADEKIIKWVIGIVVFALIIYMVFRFGLNGRARGLNIFGEQNNTDIDNVVEDVKVLNNECPAVVATFKIPDLHERTKQFIFFDKVNTRLFLDFDKDFIIDKILDGGEIYLFDPVGEGFWGKLAANYRGTMDALGFKGQYFVTGRIAKNSHDGKSYVYFDSEVKDPDAREKISMALPDMTTIDRIDGSYIYKGAGGIFLCKEK